MDDFIDDSDAKIDISAEIRNIFGYDRRKFRDEVRKMILLYWMRPKQDLNKKDILCVKYGNLFLFIG